MRLPRYDTQAAKQTVSVTINSDLYSKAKRLGINVSQIAEKAIAAEYSARRAQALRAELEQELAALESYEEQQSSTARSGTWCVRKKNQDGAV